jgi:hypothetical protein
MQIATVEERPDLVEPAWELTCDVLPEYETTMATFSTATGAG